MANESGENLKTESEGLPTSDNVVPEKENHSETDEFKETLSNYQAEVSDLKSKLETEILNRDIENLIRETSDQLKKDGLKFDREKLDRILSHISVNRANYQSVVADVVGSIQEKNEIETPVNSQPRADINVDRFSDIRNRASLWKGF